MNEEEAIKYLIISFFGFMGLLAVLTFLGKPITIPSMGETTVFTAIIIVTAIVAIVALIGMVIKLIEVVSSFLK
ncbi:MAG: hypothetical protein ACFFAU_16315 [Candidatus Hodarchaeota archaeon]